MTIFGNGLYKNKKNEPLIITNTTHSYIHNNVNNLTLIIVTAFFLFAL